MIFLPHLCGRKIIKLFLDLAETLSTSSYKQTKNTSVKV